MKDEHHIHHTRTLSLLLTVLSLVLLLPGITAYAQESLGDIVFVDLPKVGTEITAGKTFGTVESVKAVSDLYAPTSGTVTEVNGELATAPENVNKDAHSAWMIKVTLKNPGELNSLLSAADYEKFVAEESGK